MNLLVMVLHLIVDVRMYHHILHKLIIVVVGMVNNLWSFLPYNYSKSKLITDCSSLLLGIHKVGGFLLVEILF